MSGKGLNGALVVFLAGGLRVGVGSSCIGALRIWVEEALLRLEVPAFSWGERRRRDSTKVFLFLASVLVVWESES